MGALSTFTANVGQSNYIAANSFLDKLPGYQRTVIDTVSIMWGTVGGMGMRYKAFGDNDFTPQHLLLSIDDCSKILHLVVTSVGRIPEWVGANYFDESIKDYVIAPSAGLVKDPPMMMNETVSDARQMEPHEDLPET